MFQNQNIMVSRCDMTQCAEGVKQNKQRVVYWYTKAAEQGNTIS